MFQIYGAPLPHYVDEIRIGGICPYCDKGTRFTRTTNPQGNRLGEDRIKHFILSYSCDICLEPIPIKWRISGWSGDRPAVDRGEEVLPATPPYDFSYVPDAIREEIEESLRCLAVRAYNGFAATTRRAVQAICQDIGVAGTTKIQSQIAELVQIGELGEEFHALANQIMLAGHDGAHPHLPEVNSERAQLLLSLMQDLTSQIYTRRGNIRASAELRKQEQKAKSAGTSA